MSQGGVSAKWYSRGWFSLMIDRHGDGTSFSTMCMILTIGLLIAQS